MPWQGHLVVGVSVSNDDEAKRILKQLGASAEKVDEEEFLTNVAVFKELRFKGRTHKVCIQFAWEQESGGPWPVTPRNRHDGGTDAAVFFNLTGRYQGCILDHGYPHGAPEPFAIDPQDLTDILAEVRKWWPEAQVLLWTRHH